ncbi:MAG: dihydroneopterin aldolase [Propionibacteriaceae bacterium]|nr:dihydroneopterin aldolase [Propionibacteriaceae bacterium]
MKYDIELKGIHAKGCHGVYESEKRNPQTFIIDVQLRLERNPQDDLSSTVDYSALPAQISELVERNSFDLIETLADKIAEQCLALEPVRRVRVQVFKPEVKIGAQVSVRVERKK